MPTRILLADDSVTIQKVVELTFSDKSYEVMTVSDGEAAIRRAKEKRPDIILLDVIMPGMDGYEVCSVLKQDPDLKEVPVLLLTGTFEVFDTERSQHVGADGFITKPFESGELIARVRRLVGQQRAEPASSAGDLDAELVLPELERDDTVDPKGKARQAMDEEEFPEFTFDTDTESMDSEVLFDFSKEQANAGALDDALGARAARGAQAKRSGTAPARGGAATKGGDPTFDVPEFDIPDEGRGRAQGAAGQSFWDMEEKELAPNLAALKGKGGKADASRFVFEETQRLGVRPPSPDETAIIKAPSAPSIDFVKPLLDRIEKLEAAMAKVNAAPQPRPGDNVEEALKRTMPQLVDRVTESVSARLPDLMDRASERLSGKVAENIMGKLSQSGNFDAKEIISSIAWQVVPDVAEMIVRREIEEIRRNI